MPLVDYVIVIACVLVAALLAGAERRLVRGLNRVLRPIVVRPWAASLVMGGISLGLSLWFGLRHPLHEAMVHDEFSYLLAAETFADGRLTNPTHPHYEFFESYHIFHRPTYQSKYPPAQSAVLAIGILLGHPIYGVWLSLALASAACGWAYYGWLPPRWAFVAGLVTATCPDIVIQWGQSFWGGAVAMFGGALLFGALPRLTRRPGILLTITMGLGIAVLANSRPQEGAIAAAFAAIWLLAWIAGPKRPAFRTLFSRIIVPMAIVLGVLAVWILYYNKTLTGSAWTLPYQLGAEAHAEITKRHEKPYVGSALMTPVERCQRLWQFYWRILLSVPLVGLISMRRRPRMWFVLAVVSVSVAASVATSAAQTHYVAPITCLIILLPVMGLRGLSTCHGIRRRFGRTFSRLWVLGYAIGVAVTLPLLEKSWQQAEAQSWVRNREKVAQQVLAAGDSALVFVHYPFEFWHEFLHAEWVYNGADIDLQPVIWARDMGSHNQVLIDYYTKLQPDRQIWLVDLEQPAAQRKPQRYAEARPADETQAEEQSPK